MGYWKIENFREPVTYVKGAEIVLFWDCKVYPFPDRLKPDLIYEKIECDVKEMGFEGEMSIWAYVDEKNESFAEILREKTWEARIYFLPRGDNPSRRILNDIMTWQIDSPVARPELKTVMVVSDKVFSDKELLRRFKVWIYCGYIVYMLGAPPDSSSESPEWPIPFLDKGYLLLRPKQVEALKLESEEEGNSSEGRADVDVDDQAVGIKLESQEVGNSSKGRADMDVDDQAVGIKLESQEEGKPPKRRADVEVDDQAVGIKLESQEGKPLPPKRRAVAEGSNDQG